MAGKITHKFTSGIADGADTTKVRPSNWNASLNMSEGTDGQFAQRDSAQTDGWKWAGAGSLQQSFRNLLIRTHPDNSVAKSKIMLVRADEITMDDGTRVPDWDRVEADITVSGAGGLDTGSEAATVWYEAYAIRKSSDGTKNLLFHRFKDWFLDQSETNANASDNLRDTSARTKLAQGIQVATAGKVEFIDIVLDRDGTPASTSSIWLTIETDSAGNPSGTVLATSDKLDASKIVDLSAGARIRFPFRNPATLSTSTQYHIVLQADYTISAVNFIKWAGSNANTYPNGSAKKFDGAAWTAATSIDFNFRLYVTRNDTAVTMPAGYDQKARVGFFFNSGVSDLDPLVYKDKRGTWLVNTSVGTFTATTASFLDLDANFIIPAIPATIDVVIANSAAGNSVMAAGATDGFGMTFNDVGGSGGIQGVSTLANSGAPQLFIGTIMTEYQGSYVMTSAGTAQIWMPAFTW